MRDLLRGIALWMATSFRATPVVATLGFGLSSLRGLMAPMETYAVKLLIDGVVGHQITLLAAAGSMLIVSRAHVRPEGAGTTDRGDDT
jgi:hypothetical protein